MLEHSFGDDLCLLYLTKVNKIQRYEAILEIFVEIEFMTSFFLKGIRKSANKNFDQHFGARGKFAFFGSLILA